MKLEECIDLLFDGKKLRKDTWKPEEYIYVEENKVWYQKRLAASLGTFLSWNHDNWEVYDEDKMVIPDSFWEMVDPKWNYLIMYLSVAWYLSKDRPILKDGAWQDGREYLRLTLSHFDWYKEPEDWTTTLYKRPGVE